MTVDDYEPLINRLIALFPQRPIPPATIAAYWELLNDLDADIFTLAVRECAVSCDWFPTVKQLRHAAEDVIMAGIPDPYEAMRRFPHRVENPMMRSILSISDEELLRARDEGLQRRNGRSHFLPAATRELRITGGSEG